MQKGMLQVGRQGGKGKGFRGGGLEAGRAKAVGLQAGKLVDPPQGALPAGWVLWALRAM